MKLGVPTIVLSGGGRFIRRGGLRDTKVQQLRGAPRALPSAEHPVGTIKGEATCAHHPDREVVVEAPAGALRRLVRVANHGHGK